MQDSQPEMQSLEPATSGTRDLDPAGRLHQLWQIGESPDLDLFLAQEEPLTPSELAAVLRVDQRCRWETGERIDAETYLARYPRLLDDPEGAVDVIYSELLLRERQGEHPDVEEFVGRFPMLAETLREQIGLHEALDSELRTVQAAARGTRDKLVGAAPECGRYEILREIGRGGSGVVYEARQAGVKRVVALKILTAGTHAGPQQLARFHAEAELVGRLQHPHIVQIYEAGQQEGCPFLALEFVGGGSLRNRLSGAPQAPEASARLVEILARAVHAAHLAGVIHRDLKPANILFAPAPSADSDRRLPGASWSAVETPKIADFGLAKALGRSADNQTSDALTQTGDLLGTPSYMSPEQAGGFTGQIGPATDVYGLGAILYELLTGRPPFQGVTVVEVLQHVVAEDPVSPARLQPRLPRDLEVICLKCLQKQPAQRYATALDLADDLRRFVSGEPIRARPTSRLVRLGRWCRRNPVPAALGGLVGVLASALIVGSLAANLRLQKAADERLAEARVAEARAVRLSDGLGRREKIRGLLLEASQLHPGLRLRDEAIAGMALFDLPVAENGMELSHGGYGMSVDGRLARYARSDREGLVTVRRLTDDVEIRRLPELIPRAILLLSADGRFLAARADGTDELSIWSLEGDAPVAVLRATCTAVYGMGAVDFSRDGRLVAVGRRDGMVSVRSLPGGELCGEWNVGSPIRHLAIHPRHRRLALATDESVQVLDCDSGKLLARLDEAVNVFFLAWHPEGTILATADADHGVTFWQPDEFRCIRTLRGHVTYGVEFQFNASGTQLVSRAWDNLLRFWDPWEGSLLFAARETMAVRCAEDRDVWVFTGDRGKLQYRQAHEREVYRRLSRTSAADVALFLHFAPFPQPRARQRLLAVATSNEVQFWDMQAGRKVGDLPTGGVRRLGFDASGALWTNSTGGILRWTVEESADDAGTLVVGPASTVLAAGSEADLAVSPDGQTVSFGGVAGAFAWRADRTGPARELAGHYDARYVAVSPDGKWVATGSHTGANVRIWDAHSGTLIHEIRLGASRVEFSPDGKWLATTGGGLTLWSAGNWKKSWSGAGHAFSATAFTPDAALIAVESGTGVVVLYENASGKETARLTDPNGNPQISLTFSLDQRFLAGISYDERYLCVWDLGEINHQLAELGDSRDWLGSRGALAMATDSRPLKVVSRTEDRAEALARELEALTQQVAIQPGDAALHVRRARVFSQLERDAEAIESLTRALALAPLAENYSRRAAAHVMAGDYAQAIADAAAAVERSDPLSQAGAEFRNQLAWYYVTGPRELQQPGAALALAGRALRRLPGRANFLNTLGVIQYRRGEWDEAIDALKRSLAAGSDWPGCDQYFLALCHQRLGEERAAREAFGQADFWQESHASRLDRDMRRELSAFRDEAQAVLGPSRNVPEDVKGNESETP